MAAVVARGLPEDTGLRDEKERDIGRRLSDESSDDATVMCERFQAP
ncbi:hypothetical protein N185_36120 [Sinorhizobium sp. GW3]|nr:hypothetical protein N185_36120 [Sinorhizobium sp. GW3]